MHSIPPVVQLQQLLLLLYCDYYCYDYARIGGGTLYTSSCLVPGYLVHSIPVVQLQQLLWYQTVLLLRPLLLLLVYLVHHTSMHSYRQVHNLRATWSYCCTYTDVLIIYFTFSIVLLVIYSYILVLDSSTSTLLIVLIVV